MITLIAAFAGPRPAKAQTLSTGRLQGIVADEAGQLVANAIVTLRDRSSFATMRQTLDRRGEFSFLFLSPGEFDLTVEAFGHRPTRIESIGVLGSQTTSLSVVVTRSDDPAAISEVRQHEGAGPNALTVFPAEMFSRFPESTRAVNSIARLSALTDETLETEGLPAYLSGVRTDGVPTGVASIRGYALSMPLPLGAVRHAELLTSADVELNGMAAPALSTYFREPSASTAVQAFGDYMVGPETTQDLGAAAFSGVRAGGLISGPLQRDTSGFLLGLELWRLEQPLAFAADVRTAAQQVADATPVQYQLEDLINSDAASAFGRLNWMLGGKHMLSASGAFTSLPSANIAPMLNGWIGANTTAEGNDAFASLSLRSAFSASIGNEFRLSWDRTLRDYDGADAALAQTGTLLVPNGLSLGRDPFLSGRFEANTLRMRETLHLWNAQHHLKFGGSLDLPSYDQLRGAPQSATFWFGSTTDLANQQGYAVQSSGTAEASFSMPQLGAFLQDEWTLSPQLRILIGARWDFDMPPTDDVIVDDEFLRLSGLRSDSAISRRGRLSPRFEFEWRPDQAGRWVVRGSAGVWDVPMDPVLVGEVLANHGGVTVQRAFGTFAQWPQANGQGGARALTLATTAFQGPRSKRGTLQVSTQIATGVQLDLFGAYRNTEFLPVRRDLNLIATAASEDQYGRPVFGELQLQNGILVATPESNRRFVDYDVVSAINVDGTSTYAGIGGALQAQLSDVFFLHAGYTFSRTEDNWFMARESGHGAAITPFPAQTADEWTEGRSDFDVPHRAVMGAELALPALRGLRLAALYRYRSGQPFTPGFRDGVDANGDGSMRNDPAFIDSSLAGFDAIANEWSCLRTQDRNVAERNSCRAPAVSSLDARLTFDFLSGARSAEIVIDALNLISNGGEVLDHALYLVDAAGVLTTGTNGSVIVPLHVNGNFGKPLYRSAAERALRIGMRVRF